MGLFNTHVQLNPFHAGFDPTPFLNLGVSHTVDSQLGATNSVPGTLAVKSVGAGTHSAYTPPAHPNADSTPAASGGYVQGAQTTLAQQQASAAQAAQDAANHQAISLANAAIGRLPGQLQTALGQVQHTYDQNNNELQGGFNNAQQGYHQSSDQNGQQFVTNKNQISDQASQGIRSLLSILAQHGAGGSSAALYAAPNAVGQLEAQQRAGAGQTFGQNQQALDTNWNNYQTGFDNSKKQLADWLAQNQDQVRSDSEVNRQNLLTQIAGLQSSPAAAQPYIDKINASADKVDQLAKFDPTYTGKSPVYNAPNVATYTVDQTGAPVLGAPGNGTGASPALAFLLGLNKDKNLQPTFGF